MTTYSKYEEKSPAKQIGRVERYLIWLKWSTFNTKRLNFKNLNFLNLKTPFPYKNIKTTTILEYIFKYNIVKNVVIKFSNKRDLVSYNL